MWTKSEQHLWNIKKLKLLSLFYISFNSYNQSAILTIFKVQSIDNIYNNHKKAPSSDRVMMTKSFFWTVVSELLHFQSCFMLRSISTVLYFNRQIKVIFILNTDNSHTVDISSLASILYSIIIHLISDQCHTRGEHGIKCIYLAESCHNISQRFCIFKIRTIIKPYIKVPIYPRLFYQCLVVCFTCQSMDIYFMHLSSCVSIKPSFL